MVQTPDFSLCARPMRKQDLPGVMRVIRAHPDMYGAEFTKEQKDDFCEAASLSWARSRVTPSVKVFVIDRYAGDASEVAAYGCVHYWQGLPTWSIGSVFIDPTVKNVAHVKYIGLIFEEALLHAEADKRFEGYFISKHDKNQRWMRRSFNYAPYLSANYNMQDVEVIRPRTPSEFESFNNMLGSFKGANESQLVVRRLIRKAPTFLPID